MKIQVSEVTANMLVEMGDFDLEKRGHIEVKVGLYIVQFERIQKNCF